MPTEATKRCSTCRENLPLSSFYKNCSKKDGLQGDCKECRKSTVYPYNDAHKRERLLTNKNSRIGKRQYVYNYLVTHPCVDCGETDIIVLEFDHVRGEKIMGVAQMIERTVSMERLKAEIEKCEVRCCNCHRRVTVQRMGGCWRIELALEAV